jgi:hypothetical protein
MSGIRFEPLYVHCRHCGEAIDFAGFEFPQQVENIGEALKLLEAEALKRHACDERPKASP